MSSHHTIRENQEPAVLLLDVESVSFDVLEDVLEWSPTLVVSYQCIDWVIANQLKVDVVLGPQEKKEGIMNQLAFQWPIKYVISKEDVFYAGIQYICSTNNFAIHVFTSEDSVTRYEDYRKLEKEHASLKLNYINQREQSFLIETKEFSKWYQAETQIKLTAANENVLLKINKEEFELSEELVYQVSKDSLLRFQIDNPIFLTTRI